jgi:hypothetical protein
MTRLYVPATLASLAGLEGRAPLETGRAVVATDGS